MAVFLVFKIKYSENNVEISINIAYKSSNCKLDILQLNFYKKLKLSIKFFQVKPIYNM